uniref:Calcium-transporting ATPase n=1 Tax=Brugia malayi TaxID=6279 RepID=A0A0I9N7P5_BRUMA|nr:BMA-PMR-1 [Brugia malayi]
MTAETDVNIINSIITAIPATATFTTATTTTAIETAINAISTTTTATTTTTTATVVYTTDNNVLVTSPLCEIGTTLDTVIPESFMTSTNVEEELERCQNVSLSESDIIIGTGGLKRDIMIQSISALQASTLSYVECANSLRTDIKQGLSSAEVVRRQKYNGYNEFEIQDHYPIWKKYLDQFNNPLIILLLTSAAISLLMGRGEDAISITVAIVIVVTVGFVQEYRSEKTLEHLNKLVPPMCHTIRDGHEVQFLARQLVPGDIVLLNVGDRIPADLRLFEAYDLQVDESSFTGELEPRHKYVKSLTTDGGNFDHTDNIVYMGTLVRGGHGKGIVIGTGAHTRFGEVFKMMQAEEAPKTPLQNSMDYLGKQLSLYSFAIIIIIFFIGLFQGRNTLDMFRIAVSLAVAAIPEGLPIVVAVTLAIGVIRMASRRAVVKKLPAVEALGCVTVICSDKTGTLTKNEMTAVVVVSADGQIADVLGVGYSLEGGLCTVGSERVVGYSHPSISRVIEIGCICNNAIISDGILIGQPTEGALLVLGMKTELNEQVKNYKLIKEIPFTSETKFMAVQCEHIRSNGQSELFVKGALDRILEMCTGYLEGDKNPVKLNDAAKERFMETSRSLGSRGLRVIALAYGYNERELCYAGMVGIVDPPRPGVAESIEIVQSAGVKVKMVTGDALETACSIGAHLKLFTEGDACLSGFEMDRMTDLDLERVIKSVTIFYRSSPKHKLRIVKALQNLGEVVAMTGDGVNDVVALKKADIGIAMGSTGTDVCKEAADMILTDDDFYTIQAAVEEGKGIYHNITNFVRFQLSTSVAALSLIAISTLFEFENPLNAMQILWINIIMDGPPAQSLGVEPVDRDIIRQPSRDVRQPMINNAFITNIFISAAIIIAGTLSVFYKEMSADNEVTPRDTTMTFTCFVLFDMWNALACRSSRKLIWEIGLLRNRMFCFAVFGSIFCQLAVIYFPPLQKIFQTEALSLYDLIFLTVLTSTVFIVAETRKYLELKMKKTPYMIIDEPTNF